jgi:hypothetical protein
VELVTTLDAAVVATFVAVVAGVTAVFWTMLHCTPVFANCTVQPVMFRMVDEGTLIGDAILYVCPGIPRT